jgi:hypothetical protein
VCLLDPNLTLWRWQCESPDDSPESSPRGDPLGYHQTVDEQAGVGADAGRQEDCVQRPEADSGIENDTNKENTPVMRVANVATINAAEEVSKVLAARRQRVEQAMQTTERHKEELASLPVNRKQREALGEALQIATLFCLCLPHSVPDFIFSSQPANSRNASYSRLNNGFQTRRRRKS